ncbi:MAG: hypothetical protein ACE5IM_10245 [Nitrospinota bacterium]
MAVVKAQRALMAVHGRDVSALVEALQGSALLEPIDPGDWPAEEGELALARPFGGGLFELEEAAASLRRCIGFLEAHVPVKGGLKSFLTPRPTLTLQALTGRFHRFPLDAVAEKFRLAEAALRRIATEEAQISQLREVLEVWRGVDAPLSHLRGLRAAAVVLGDGPPGVLGRLMRALGGAARWTHGEVLESDKAGERFVLVFLEGEREAVEVALREAGAAVLEAPFGLLSSVGLSLDLEATPAETLAELDLRLRELEESRRRVLERSRELDVYREGLQAAWDYVHILKARKDAEGWLVRVGDIALGMGWVLEDRKDDLEDLLQRSLPQVHVVFLENGPEDVPPVRLKNAPLVRPFSVMTGLYGLPKPAEADPTPLLAPFFFVFFGLCLTDSGYGVLIALFFWWGLRRLQLGPGGRDFFRMVLLGGLSAAFFGAFVSVVTILQIGIMLGALFTVHLGAGFSFMNVVGGSEAGPQFGLPGFDLAD